MDSHTYVGRRDFLKTTGGAALFSLLPFAASGGAQVLRGLDRPGAAVIGLGNRGRGLAEWQMPPFAARLQYPGGVELWFLSSFADSQTAAKTEPLKQELELIYEKVPESIRNDTRCGVLFVGSQGTIFAGRDEIEAKGIGELEKVPLAENSSVRWKTCLYYHMSNFLECVKTRQKPASHVAEQHRTLIPCHLTNIALRLGRKLRWNPQREEFVDAPDANAMLSRSQRSPYQTK